MYGRNFGWPTLGLRRAGAVPSRSTLPARLSTVFPALAQNRARATVVLNVMVHRDLKPGRLPATNSPPSAGRKSWEKNLAPSCLELSALRLPYRTYCADLLERRTKALISLAMPAQLSDLLIAPEAPHSSAKASSSARFRSENRMTGQISPAP